MPSASPTGTPKHSVKKMTSTEDPKGPHGQGLFMMPPAGMGLGSLKSEFVPSASIKQRGQQAMPPVSQSPSSPGKKEELHSKGGPVLKPSGELWGVRSHGGG